MSIKSRKHTTPPAFPLSAGATATALAAGLALSCPLSATAQSAPADNAKSLAPVNVVGQDNTYKPEQLSSPKFTQPLVDTTQTVTVIPQEVIRQQQATTLTDAMRNVPGAGTFYAGENGSSTTGDAIYMRGLDTSNSIYVDGIRDTTTASRDMFNVDSIEVIKGPSGSDFGRGAPTGSINLVTKKPMLGNSFDASLGVGTADSLRSTIDWNHALSDTSAFRLNLMGNKTGVAGRDTVENKRWGIAPSLAFGLNTPTTVYIDYVHVKQNNIPDGRVPTLGLPGFQGGNATDPAWAAALANAPQVDSHNWYGTASDHDNSTSDMFTVRVDHKFTPDTVLHNTTRWAQTKQDYLLSSFMFSPDGTSPSLTGDPADLSTWQMRRLMTVRDSVNKILTNQTNVTSKFDTGSIKHSLSAGVELIREEQTLYNHSVDASLVPAVSVYSPDNNLFVHDAVSGRVNSNTGKTDTIAAYAFDTVELTNRWLVNGGLRYDHYKTNYSGYTSATAATASNLNASGGLFSWKLGTLYRVAPNGNVYVNYGVSQQPPGGNSFALTDPDCTGRCDNANRTNFKPQKAKTLELGTKWELFNKNLLTTAALFRTNIENEAQVVDGNVEQIGKKRVQGLELGAIGQITPRWSVIGGYTFQNAKIDVGSVVSQDGSSGLAYTPKHALSLWTTYRVLDALTVGGGARYVSGLSKGTDGATITPNHTDSYVVFDAMASYRVNRNLNLQLNLYNLFDKDYVAGINKSGYRYTPGIGRSAMLTANFSF